MSRYLMMVRYLPGQGPEEGSPEHGAEMQAWDRFNAELDASGGLVRSFGLDPSKRVLSAEARSDAGGEVVFAQYVVEADALEEIERWARRMPVMDYGSVEIRKVMFEGPR